MREDRRRELEPEGEGGGRDKLADELSAISIGEGFRAPSAPPSSARAFALPIGIAINDRDTKLDDSQHTDR